MLEIRKISRGKWINHPTVFLANYSVMTRKLECSKKGLRNIDREILFACGVLGYGFQKTNFCIYLLKRALLRDSFSFSRTFMKI